MTTVPTYCESGCSNSSRVSRWRGPRGVVGSYRRKACRAKWTDGPCALPLWPHLGLGAQHHHQSQSTGAVSCATRPVGGGGISVAASSSPMSSAALHRSKPLRLAARGFDDFDAHLLDPPTARFGRDAAGCASAFVARPSARCSLTAAAGIPTSTTRTAHTGTSHAGNASCMCWSSDPGGRSGGNGGGKLTTLPSRWVV